MGGQEALQDSFPTDVVLYPQTALCWSPRVKLPLIGNSTLRSRKDCANGCPRPWLSPHLILLQFLEQENQMARTQLLEVEARLRSTLDTLQEHSLQHEELMDSHQRLRY